MNLLAAGVAGLLLAAEHNAKAAEMGVRGLRSMETADANPHEVDTAIEINPIANEVKDEGRALDCMGDGTYCDSIEGMGFDSCENCCSKPATFWPDRAFWACGQMPCWGTNTRCLAGTTCNSCCNGYRWVWEWFGDHCN